jgi:ribosome-associated protein
MEPLVVTARIVVPGNELSVVAVRSSGPGGQNVNKVSTKIELRFRVVETKALPEAARLRLLAFAKNRLDSEGNLVVVCDETRSRAQNSELARARLREWIRSCLAAPRVRRPTRPTRASKERRLGEKSKRGERKRERSARHD